MNLSGLKVSLVYLVSSRTPIGNDETLSQKSKIDPPQKKLKKNGMCLLVLSLYVGVWKAPYVVLEYQVTVSSTVRKGIHARWWWTCLSSQD